MTLDFLDNQPDTEPVQYGETFDNLIVENLVSSGYTRTSNRMRGAELGQECIRKNTLRLDTLQVDPMSGWGVIATESGTAIENFIVRNIILNDPEKVAAYNMWCPKIPELDFSGKLDFIYRPTETELVVVDFKTTQRLNEKEHVVPYEKATALVEEFSEDTEELLKALKKSKKYSAKSTLTTMDDYMWQVATYCTFTFIENGMVYVISRSPEEWKEPFTRRYYEFLVDSDVRNLVVARGLVAQHAYNEGRLVPKPKNYKKTVQCKYCDFNDHCWKTPKNDPWKYYTDEEFNKLFKNALAHAPNILAENEVRLKNARYRAIEDTKEKIELIHNPTEEKVKAYIEKSEINFLDLMFGIRSLWDKEDQEKYIVNLSVKIGS